MTGCPPIFRLHAILPNGNNVVIGRDKGILLRDSCRANCLAIYHLHGKDNVSAEDENEMVNRLDCLLYGIRIADSAIINISVLKWIHLIQTIQY